MTLILKSNILIHLEKSANPIYLIFINGLIEKN